MNKSRRTSLFRPHDARRMSQADRTALERWIRAICGSSFVSVSVRKPLVEWHRCDAAEVAAATQVLDNMRCRPDSQACYIPPFVDVRAVKEWWSPHVRATAGVHATPLRWHLSVAAGGYAPGTTGTDSRVANSSMLPAMRNSNQELDDFLHCLTDTLRLLCSCRGNVRIPGSLHVVWLPFPAKKCMPTRRGTASTRRGFEPVPEFEPVHFNSGVTITYGGRGIGDGVSCEIVVFRSQEACKVLIHELLHAFDYASNLRGPQFASLDLQIRTRFNVQSAHNRVGLDEACVEAMAHALHSIWSSSKTGKCGNASNATATDILVPQSRERGALAAFREMRGHMMRVARRVLSLVGRQYPGDAVERHPFHERTHVFAYVVCATALLHESVFMRLVEATDFSFFSLSNTEKKRQSPDMLGMASIAHMIRVLESPSVWVELR